MSEEIIINTMVSVNTLRDRSGEYEINGRELHFLKDAMTLYSVEGAVIATGNRGDVTNLDKGIYLISRDSNVIAKIIVK